MMTSIWIFQMTTWGTKLAKKLVNLELLVFGVIK